MENNVPPPTEFPQPSGPPTLPPPPIITTSPLVPPRPRKSVGWMITALILFCLLVLSLFTHLGSFLGKLTPSTISLQETAGPRLEETLVKAGKSESKIAVISLEGIIMGESLDGSGYTLVQIIQAQLKRAAADKDVKAVLLKVDSPGGEALASDEIYRAILKFQKESRKPVVASMGAVAASGGYYVSAPCQWIVANEMTITGSIGVIMEGLNYRGLMDKVGLAPMIYKSGKYKDMLSGMRETNEIHVGEQAMVQGLIDETYGVFTNVVWEGRIRAYTNNGTAGRPLANNWLEFADGRVLSGSEALKLGFVDHLGNFDDAVKQAEKIANDGNKANLVEYRERYDISNILSLLGQSNQAHEIKLDTGLDIPKLRAGALYFLWQPPAN